MSSRMRVALVLGIVMGAFAAVGTASAASDVVISQVYGAGGNVGALRTHDYVELYNRGPLALPLGNLSIQYASATGTGNFGSSSTQLTELPDFTLQPGQYFLIQEGSAAMVGDPLPTADHVDPTPILMAAGAGKVALVSGDETLNCNGSVGQPCSAASLARILDLVGYGNANFFEGSGAAPTLGTTLAALRAGNGAQDTDNNAVDFAAATPNPRNSVVGDAAPSVSSSSPTAGATGVARASNVSITFSEPVDVTGTWYTIECNASGSHAATPSGGPTTYSLDPTTDFAANETCTVKVLAAGVTDQDTQDPPNQMAADHTFTFQTVDQAVCGDAATKIGAIQGAGATAAITGNVSVEGVVVGDFEGPTTAGLQGFYLQDSGDGNDATSDGIFVFTGNTDNSLAAGDVVRVTGFARERFGQTTINGSNSDTAAVTNIVDCQATGSVPTTDVSMPFAALDSPERYEGMLVRFPQDLVIAEYFNYDQFGELVLALPLPGESRPFTPTAIDEPGAAANARNTANLLRRITLDDTLAASNPSVASSSERQPVLVDERVPRRRPRPERGGRPDVRVQPLPHRADPPGRLHRGEPAAGRARARRRHAPRGCDEHAQLLHHRRLPDGRSAGQQVLAVPDDGVPRVRRRPAGRVHPAARQARRGRGRRER